MAEHPKDDPEIPPALTEAEWREWIAGHGTAFSYRAASLDRLEYCVETRYADGRDLTIDGHYDERQRHTLAAILLYGTPEGFTQEEVEVLAILVNEGERSYVFRHNGDDGEALVKSVLAKVRALLPPPETL